MYLLKIRDGESFRCEMLWRKKKHTEASHSLVCVCVMDTVEVFHLCLRWKFFTPAVQNVRASIYLFTMLNSFGVFVLLMVTFVRYLTW